MTIGMESLNQFWSTVAMRNGYHEDPEEEYPYGSQQSFRNSTDTTGRHQSKEEVEYVLLLFFFTYLKLFILDWGIDN